MNRSAACLIIGDEILSGRTRDTNSGYIAEKLFIKGIDLKEIRVVGDDEDDIACAAAELSLKFDYVFVTGGIGPTHDDITCASIARSLGVPIEINAQALSIIKSYYKSRDEHMNERRESMAKMPKGANLILNTLTGAPGFVIKNLFVMAGVPEIMRFMLDNVLKNLPAGQVLHQYSVKIYAPESSIASLIEKLQEKYKEVKIGSYPQNLAEKFYTEIVAKSYDKNALSRVELGLKIIAVQYPK